MPGFEPRRPKEMKWTPEDRDQGVSELAICWFFVGVLESIALFDFFLLSGLRERRCRGRRPRREISPVPASAVNFKARSCLVLPHLRSLVCRIMLCDLNASATGGRKASSTEGEEVEELLEYR